MIDRPVGDVLKGKSSPNLLSVASTATVSEAVALMDEKGLGSVLVRDAAGKMAGIFTERDLMRRVVRQGRDPKTTPMSAVMSPDVRHVPATESIVEVLRIMVEHGYRHMLVSDNGKPAGVVSIRDLMGWLILPDAPIAHEGRRGEIRTRALDTVETLKQG
ncbi:MAG: CBS domain-containing protein [Betaproteobacteria bacterium]|nr:CBS domain-containing protein [Betaproteobacteria bacterium]PWB61589.1 MAG: inosine-5-monophosphate dehydrogenase [Betaproteobacteria bacterium]